MKLISLYELEQQYSDALGPDEPNTEDVGLGIDFTDSSSSKSGASPHSQGHS